MDLPLLVPFELTVDLVHDPSGGPSRLGIVLDGTDVPGDLYVCDYWPDASIVGAVRVTAPGERALLPIEELDPKMLCLFRSAEQLTLQEINAPGGGPADGLGAWIVTTPNGSDYLQVALTDDDGVVYDGWAGARPWR